MFRDDTVAGSWAHLESRLDAAQAVARWAEAEPVLAGLTCVEELAELTRVGCDRDRADEVLGALARRAAADGGDDPDAVLVLMHLLADGVRVLAGRLADLDAAGDILGLVAGQLAIEIRQFPWRRRRRAYAANLLLDTRRSVLREVGFRRGSRVPVVPVGLSIPPWWVALAKPAAGVDTPTPRMELVDVLAWAARRQVADPADLRLVWQLEQLRGYGAAAEARVAAAWGVHARTVRRVRARTLAALQAAAPDYLAA